MFDFFTKKEHRELAEQIESAVLDQVGNSVAEFLNGHTSAKFEALFNDFVDHVERSDPEVFSDLYVAYREEVSATILATLASAEWRLKVSMDGAEVIGAKDHTRQTLLEGVMKVANNALQCGAIAVRQPFLEL